MSLCSKFRNMTASSGARHHIPTQDSKFMSSIANSEAWRQICENDCEFGKSTTAILYNIQKHYMVRDSDSSSTTINIKIRIKQLVKKPEANMKHEGKYRNSEVPQENLTVNESWPKIWTIWQIQKHHKKSLKTSSKVKEQQILRLQWVHETEL